MPGSFTITTAKLHCFCWIIWGDSARLNWQPKCHFACRAEATNRIPSFKSRALQLRAHRAPRESFPHMGLPNRRSDMLLCKSSKQGNDEYENKGVIQFSPCLREKYTFLCLSNLCYRLVRIPGSTLSVFQVGYRVFEMASLLLLSTNVTPLRSLLRS